MAKRYWRLKSIWRILTRNARNPEAMARGIGIGIFVGFLPSVGFQMVIALFLAGFFGANRIAAAAGTFITNPFTTIPLSVLSLWIGDSLLPGTTLGNISIANFTFEKIFASSSNLIFPFLLGSLILGIIGGALSYLLMRFYYSKLQQAKQRI